MPGSTLRCQNCAALIGLEPGRPVTRSSRCPECGADLHCCVHCRFYDPTVANDCLEPQAEWVAIKDSANFCDFFSPLEVDSQSDAPIASPDATKESVREQLGKLFKK